MDLPRPIVSYYRLFLICILLLVAPACSSSGPTQTSETAATSKIATLSWDAVSHPDLQGYKIYMATVTGGYGAPISTVSKDDTRYTVTGLETGVTYFFVVTAYNSSGVESSFSNEVSTIIL